jgi:predicted esterase
LSEPATLHRLSVPKSARWYQLGELGPDTLEAWLVCHGYGQLAGRFITSFAPIASEARAIVAPEALHRFYLDPASKPAAERRVGATWMTREDREQDIADYVAYLERLADEIARLAPRARITALGFSQGAATVSRWTVASERDLARMILWGSELPPDLDWVRARRRLASVVPWFVLGDRDEFASPDRITRQESELDRHGIAHRVVRYAGGHSIDRDALVRLSEA